MIKRNRQKENQGNNLGFGNSVKGSQMIILEDGSFNIKRTGIPFLEQFSIFQYLINSPWHKFISWVLLGFAVVNLIFAGIYMELGPSQLGLSRNADYAANFWEAFFFSAQTLSTVGYGRIAPTGTGANIVAAFEAMLGLLGFAIATGIFYGRFSKPVAKIMRSPNVLISPFKGSTALMFRIANQRNSQMMEAEVEVMITMLMDEDGRKVRRFVNLPLEFKKIVFFSLSWTIVHPIDENSPLFGYTEKDLMDSELQILILFKGFDETFTQTVYSRFSYHASDIVFGAKFDSINEDHPDYATSINLSKLGSYTTVTLPEMATIAYEEK